MPKIEKIHALGAHKKQQLLDNAESILDGRCTSLTYQSDNKTVELTFTIVDENITIGKTVISPSKIPLETISVSQDELRKEAEIHLGKTLYKLLSIKEIEKSKAIPDMRSNSKGFDAKIEKLYTSQDNDETIYLLQKEISKEVALYKECHDTWISSNWDFTQKDIENQLDAKEEEVDNKTTDNEQIVVPIEKDSTVANATV